MGLLVLGGICRQVPSFGRVRGDHGGGGLVSQLRPLQLVLDGSQDGVQELLAGPPALPGLEVPLVCGESRGLDVVPQNQRGGERRVATIRILVPDDLV